MSALASASPTNWYDLPAPDWQHLFYPQRGYQYFRQPLPDPIDADAPLTAAWMADAAMLAYGRTGSDLIPKLQFDSFLQRAGLTYQKIGDWSGTAHGTQAFFAYNAKFAVLSFRGTEKDDWTDSLVDLTLLPVRETLDVPAPADAKKTLFHLGLRDPILNPFDTHEPGVHGGFQLALNAVWEQVRTALTEYRGTHPAAPIFFTGHSLGAALATLAVARFNAGKLALITFGSPRAGNKAFCDKLEAAADLGIYRFVDNRDLVTTVPPKDLFYDHTSGLMHIEQNGDIKPDGVDESGELRAIVKALSVAAAAAIDYTSQEPPPGELVDHSPSRYCYFTWRWARGGLVP
ncbi:MAG: lipase family protein [Candidatus Korobacteraceae bacterium]